MEPRVEEFIRVAKESGSFCFDIEHNPNLSCNDAENFKLHGCSFATSALVFYERDTENIKKIIGELFASDVDAVAHNAKSDIKNLVAAKIIHSYDYPENLVDTMCAENLINDNLAPNQLGLSKIVFSRYGYRMKEFMDSWNIGGEYFEEYSCDDARFELRLWLDQKPVLEQQDLMRYFRRVMMPAVAVFADIELSGLKWDIKRVKHLLRTWQEIREVVRKEIYEEIGPLNIKSGNQIAVRLFEDLNYSTRGIKLTPSGKRFATDEGAMTILASRYPVAKKILLFRTAEKLINTYIEPVTRLSLADSNERFHSTFWLVSSTGRIRSSKPNVQNFPAYFSEDMQSFLKRNYPEADVSIRKNVIAEEGKVFIIVDQSQIELRLVAHISGDVAFNKAYLEYQCTACGDKGKSKQILHECPKCNQAENERILKDSSVTGFWHGLDLHQMTADNVAPLRGNRQAGKTANFALVYYAGGFRMNAEHPEFSASQWDTIIEEYLEEYSGVRKWHKICIKALESRGMMRDIFGRKRRIPKRQAESKHAANMIINFSPQASAVGIMLLSMRDLRKKWVERKVWLNEIEIVNMVHDELVFEVDEDKVEQYIPDIVGVMENVIQLRVPLRVDCKVSKNWSKK